MVSCSRKRSESAPQQQTNNDTSNEKNVSRRKRLQCWAEAHIKIARMTLTAKLDGNWNSLQLTNNTPPLGVTGSVIAPSARMRRISRGGQAMQIDFQHLLRTCRTPGEQHPLQTGKTSRPSTQETRKVQCRTDHAQHRSKASWGNTPSKTYKTSASAGTPEPRWVLHLSEGRKSTRATNEH